MIEPPQTMILDAYTDDDWYPALPTILDRRKDSSDLSGFSNVAGKLSERQQRVLDVLTEQPCRWMPTKEIVARAGYQHKRGNGWGNTMLVLKHNLFTQPEHGWKLEKRRSKRINKLGHGSSVVEWRVVPRFDDDEEGGDQ